eukprot:scaffold23179_cov142-Isochrysis_galbana.AAC.2
MLSLEPWPCGRCLCPVFAVSWTPHLYPSLPVPPVPFFFNFACACGPCSALLCPVSWTAPPRLLLYSILDSRHATVGKCLFTASF